MTILYDPDKANEYCKLREARAQRHNAYETVKRAVERRQKIREQEEQNRRDVYDLYLDASVGLDRINDAICETRPRRYSEGFSDDFAAALMARERLREITQELAIMVSGGDV